MSFSKINREQKYLRTIQSILVLILILFVFMQIVNVHLMLGTAKAINYSGLVRGGTQRLVKLELSYLPDDYLLEEQDSLISDLQNGGGIYHLKKIGYQPFQLKLKLLKEEWTDLKDNIRLFRSGNISNEIIVNKSETYFHLADETVLAAQTYAEKLAERQNFLEIFMIFCIVLILAILAKLSIEALKYSRIAYTDKHTKLPNKSRCEEIINDKSMLDEKTAFIMFDLNYLKKVNDSLGHAAGDSLILNFATVLRRAIPSRHFLGRYGGDEFISVLKDVTEDDVKKVTEEIEDEIERFNSFSHQTEISFAYGCAHSSVFQECTIHTLLEEADKKMYEMKKQMHTLREN